MAAFLESIVQLADLFAVLLPLIIWHLHQLGLKSATEGYDGLTTMLLNPLEDLQLSEDTFDEPA